MNQPAVWIATKVEIYKIINDLAPDGMYPADLLELPEIWESAPCPGLPMAACGGVFRTQANEEKLLGSAAGVSQ